jgi:glycosyltransferase involved in cell wall biosynthesis
MKIIAGVVTRNSMLCICTLLIDLNLRAQVDEVIVVDCGSVDKTIEVIEKCVAVLSAQGDHLPVRIIQHDNADEGAAIRRLIAEAKKGDADALVLVEANGEYDPADIPKIIEPIVNCDADLVIGSRFTGDFREENKKKLTFAERVWAKTLNFVANIGATTKVTDAQSGLRAISNYAMDIISLKRDTEGVKSEMVADAVNHLIRIQEVGIGIWRDDTRSYGCD